MTPSTLPLALRNAAILGWLTSCDAPFRRMVVAEYAAYLGCPIIEVDENMIWPEDLDWLWGRYNALINAWTEDRL